MTYRQVMLGQLYMPISQKLKDVFHTMDMPSKNLTFLIIYLGQRNKKKYSKTFQTSKKTFKWYIKSEQTHRHSYGQINQIAYGPNRPNRPEGRCFKNDPGFIREGWVTTTVLIKSFFVYILILSLQHNI